MYGTGDPNQGLDIEGFVRELGGPLLMPVNGQLIQVSGGKSGMTGNPGNVHTKVADFLMSGGQAVRIAAFLNSPDVDSLTRRFDVSEEIRISGLPGSRPLAVEGISVDDKAVSSSPIELGNQIVWRLDLGLRPDYFVGVWGRDDVAVVHIITMEIGWLPYV